jgi:hypothetical protein
VTGSLLVTADLVHSMILIASIAGVLKTAERTDFAPLPTVLAAVAAVAANWFLGTGPWLVDLFSGQATVAPAPASDQPIGDTLALRQTVATMFRLVSKVLVIGAGSVFTLVLVIGAVARISTRARVVRTRRGEHVQAWAELTQAHDEIRRQWHAYLLDSHAQVRSPELNDVTLPQTQAFLDAAEDAETCRRRGSNPSAEDLTAYAEVVQRLQQAWARVAPEAEAAGPPHPPQMAAVDLEADATPQRHAADPASASAR